jgi:signal transduction histidine kinase
MARNIKIPLSTKFALTFAPLFLIVMLLTMYAVHRTVTLQFTDRYESDLQMSIDLVKRELRSRQQLIQRQLRQLGLRMQEDHEFRLRTNVLQDLHHPYIVDYAPTYMATMGLQALEITDERGMILSSGQYRSAFGGNALGLLQNIKDVDHDFVFALFDHPDGYLLCLTAAETFRIGNRTYTVLGGIEVHDQFMAGLETNPRNVMLFRTPPRSFSSNPNRIDITVFMDNDSGKGYLLPEWLHEDYSISSISIPVAERTAVQEGNIYLLHSKIELLQLLDSVNKKVYAITIVGVLFVIILAFWQAGNVARPLQRLARKASALSLDSLDDDFNINSRDEVGVLNDALKMMVQRLRLSRLNLAIAEQKAAIAEIARKINHDIKNGFIPIRNVMQHWSEVADSDPDKLAEIFKERKDTVDESLQYLQALAQDYSKSSHLMEFEPVNVKEVIDSVVRNYKDLPGKQINIESITSGDNIFISGERNQFRRAIENVVCNAVDACGDAGEVTIKTTNIDQTIVITIEDTGSGFPDEIRDQLFHRHVTTKQNGTGIGLMNTYGIITQFKGTIAVKNHDEGGAQIKIMLPILKPDSPDTSGRENQKVAPSL